jgi:hypothetical protein
LSGSRSFIRHCPITDTQDLIQRTHSGELSLALEIHAFVRLADNPAVTGPFPFSLDHLFDGLSIDAFAKSSKQRHSRAGGSQLPAESMRFPPALE